VVDADVVRSIGKFTPHVNYDTIIIGGEEDRMAFSDISLHVLKTLFSPGESHAGRIIVS
jgi:hypothetical protein